MEEEKNKNIITPTSEPTIDSGKNIKDESQEKKLKVLILDDDDFLLNMYALKFKRMFFEVDTAVNASEALQKIKEQGDFDAVLVDVVLPEMDGFEFVEKIKTENLVNKMAVIMLTNQSQPSDIERGEKLGVDGYIVKASAIPSEVVSRVKEILKEFNKK